MGRPRGRPQGGGQGGATSQPKMGEDPADHGRVVDEGDDLHLGPAPRTDERRHFPHLVDELPPRLRDEPGRVVIGDVQHGDVVGAHLLGFVARPQQTLFLTLPPGAVRVPVVIRWLSVPGSWLTEEKRGGEEQLP